MSEVKAGDVAWFQGRLVEWEDGSRRVSQVLSETAIPDSPSLPAVARFLAAHPDAVFGLTYAAQCAVDHIDSLGLSRDGTSELLARLQPLWHLIDALATDAADGGAR